VSGIRITAGAPPPKPDLDWARVHLLIVDPEYFGKVRVLLYNLRKGVDQEPAFRNAFGKSPAEVETYAKQHLAAGNFQTTTLSSRPMAVSDFEVRPVSDTDARLARADLLAGGLSVAEYQGLIREGAKVAEAEEGLGLLAVRDGANDEARKHFVAAIQAGSSSARAHIEYAKLEKDPEKASQALLKAAGINPKLEEPFVLMAQRDTDPRKRVMHWKAAVERNPRNLASWKALAECYVAEHNYAEAAKAWKEAEQAAVDPAVRAEVHRSRMTIEQQRLDYEEDEKRRAKDAEAREIEALKDKARAEVRALEAKANAGATKSDAPVVQWSDFDRPSGKAVGTLNRIDCLGNRARLTIQGSNGAVTRLLIVDPGKIAVSGGGDVTLGCGVQKSRRVTVEYFPKADAKLGTAGEVATIEFQ
jgi:tetratricopeptide (TPR) repeat protein